MRVTLDGITVELAGTTLLDGLDVRVAPGEVLGFVGPNGSGKSTALRTVYRALRPSAGAVLLDSTDLDDLPPRERARRVAAVSQDEHADLDFTVAELVALGRYPHRSGGRPLGGDEWEHCHRAMRLTDTMHLAERGVLSLSGGERRRVFLARALAQGTPVLVLDEPTNHLDIRHQLELLALIRDSGLTVLVALHDLNLAAAVCDRIAVLARGRLVRSGPPGQVLTPDLVERVFGVRPVVVPHPDTGVPQLLHTPTPPPNEERTLR
ncbi:ABC transporter ATP-binding protein [Saccharomonospora halophila]|uniref:ABC transporter ATP-binding protein n=1 Tax=Saccharomonospora halophila TaxID=129922 RepID=UPI00037600CF|nr:ABC transporter ATP-binding protein [Saccharomonospora halophila]